MTRSEIVVVSGVGEDATELGAFDAALADAGLQDYNLVTFSSVIPPGTAVVTRDRFAGGFAVGDPVAVVLARATADGDGGPVAAGLGWATAAEGGVFFEATGTTVAACRDEIAAALDGARARRDWDWAGEAVRTAVHDADRPAAAVVAAVYGRLDLRSLPLDG